MTLCCVLTATAEDSIPRRNCRPQLEERGIPAYAHRRVTTVLDPHQPPLRRAEAENPLVGDRRQLVVLAAFSDYSFKGNQEQTLELWDKIFNMKHLQEAPFRGSIHDYFYDQSYGQLRISFDLHYVPVGNRERYRSTDKDDENSKYLVQDIVEVLQNEVDDWAPYDWDGDGYVDQLIIVFAGLGMNNSSDPNTIWPHQWWLSKHKNFQSIAVSSGGKDYLVDAYCCVQELYGMDTYGSFGMICHEYSHCFGLPDFYRGAVTFVSSWDLMDSGDKNSGGFCPCNYSSFERAFMGWMTPVELTDAVTITDMPALNDQPVAYLVRNEGEPQEYYLVENRQRTNWDTSLPGSGIIVFHVDYDEAIFRDSLVNSSIRKRYSIFAANNPNMPTLKSYLSGWGYPYQGNDELTNTSAPAATLNNANTDGTFFMSKPITLMTITDGLASFHFGGNTTDITAPTVNGQPSPDAWYTLDGRMLSGKPTMKGVYFHGGKKVLVTDERMTH